MEIPVTAGPWLVLGLVLGILLALLGTLAARALGGRAGTPRATGAPSRGPLVDDLPGFLASPPGSGPAAPRWDQGWPPLSAPAPTAQAVPAGAVGRGGSGSTGLLGAMAAAALLLVGAAAVVATVGTAEPVQDAAPGTGPPPRQDPAAPSTVPVSAELSFGSVVLERHAVGVTVALPTVRVASADGRTTAEVELITFNCLRDEAPPDPAAAGCSRSVTEYADLSEPELAVRTDDGTLRVSGAFPTWLRPNGTPPVATGRVYELAVTAAPRNGRGDEGRQAATGVLEVGGEQVGIRDDGTSAITVGG